MTSRNPNPQRPWLAARGNDARQPIAKPLTGASYCPDGTGHHWVIDPPNGTTFSPGTCKKCGAEKLHRNSLDNEGNWTEMTTATFETRRAS